MRIAIALFVQLFISFASLGQAAVVITPSTPPVVKEGTTFKFTASVPVTWSMAAGARGTVDPDGTYHAPASVRSQQSYGGCQLLPNDHVYNTRIDSLPINSNSSAWISESGPTPINYISTYPVNYIDQSARIQAMAFFYTPANSGPYMIPQYPTARIESGWFTFGNGEDRHFFTIDPTNCNFQEMYDYYAPGQNPKCPSCTSQSGVKYSSATYMLPTNGATNAAGTYIMPLTLRLQELENAVASGGTIDHALQFTLNNASINNSYIWPATATSFSVGGTIPFGARFRLKSSFDISSFSPITQVLLTQLKQYGIILTDGGLGWQISTEYTDWPVAYQNAFNEIRSAVIEPSNFEAVDESGLMISPSSGATIRSERVIATNRAGQSSSQYIILTGVTVGLPKDELYVQAGAQPQQLVAYSNGGVKWSMTPLVGTLTTDGLYTPPSTAVSDMTTAITATSTVNPNVSDSMPLTVLTSGTIRIALGRYSPYKDSQGSIWQPSVAADSANVQDLTYAGVWPSIPDIFLYQAQLFPYYQNDIRFDIAVPNGVYAITAKFASNMLRPGLQSESLEAQGRIIYPAVDLYAAAGGSNKPVDFSMVATVTNGELSVVFRHLKGPFGMAGIEISRTSDIESLGQPPPPIVLSVTVH